MRVTVYSKPECHLCEDVLVILDRLAPQYGLEVSETNILNDMPLYEAYRNSIPVVEIEDGRLGRLQAPMSEADLRAAFDIARRAYPAGGGVQAVQASKTGSTREPLLDRLARYIGRHWLGLVCIALTVFVGLPWLAAVFAGLGWWDLVNPIYTVYALSCHQLPERAGFVMGYQVAFCYRNTALYGGVLLFGLLFGLARNRDVAWLRWLRDPLPAWALVLFVLPMALDGLTHMLGLRDSVMETMDASFGSFYIGSQAFSLNWWLRIVTGLLAALGVVWFAFPRMDRTVEVSENLRLAYE